MKSAYRIHNADLVAQGVHKLNKVLHLHQHDLLPEQIEVELFVIPILLVLRNIYGKSNFGVACILLRRSITRAMAVQRAKLHAFWFTVIHGESEDEYDARLTKGVK